MAELKIGTKIDRIYKQKQKIEELNKKLSDEKGKLDKMENDIVKHLQREGLETSGGKLATVRLRDRVSYNIDDWPKLVRYVKRTNAFDLLQKRIATNAYKERVDAGKKIPGTSSYTKHTITVRKKP